MLASKWERLICCSTKLLHSCKKKKKKKKKKNYCMHWIAGRANIIYIYMSYMLYICYIYTILWVGFAFCSSFFFCHFQKLQLLVVKKFCCIILLFVWAQKVIPKIFKILFQTGDFTIFVLCCVFFSRYVQLKSSFSDENIISSEIWDKL